MAAKSLHPQDDYSNNYYIWHEWLQANGPLTEQNVLDYFSHSMFWDRQSDNQALVMQMQFSGARPADIAEELRTRWQGIQFAVVKADAPTFFVLHKLKPTPLVAYFVLHNKIFQAPDVYSVVANRLLTTLHSLEASLETVRSHRPTFAPRFGFVWPVVDTGAKTEAQRKAAAARASTTEPSTPGPVAQVATPDTTATAAPQPVTTNAAAVVTKKAVNSGPLWLAMTTTAAHARATMPALTMVSPNMPGEPPAVSDAAKAAAKAAAPAAAAASTAGVAGDGTPAAPPRRKRKRA
ncbi:MED6-domain-containing protein [Auriculariales sp. MPI-PUGE-AT-0066]|nr:MED6-domain-containing protein [Auriculariales sp. MPI-PUGE-AT-0066]